MSCHVLHKEAALEACFRRLDPEANGCITREDLIRQRKTVGGHEDVIGLGLRTEMNE
jgi:Ca2+-binding EF-hand superfamily protein